ncbi:MAG: hypothetical protein ACLTS6_22250 [Anaerobutyricum sp.]
MNMDKLYCIGYIDDELIEKADKYISKKVYLLKNGLLWQQVL